TTARRRSSRSPRSTGPTPGCGPAPTPTSSQTASRASCSTACAATPAAESCARALRAGILAGVQAVLIVNPFATRVTDELLAEVERELGRAAELTVLRTEHPLHATELVTDACRGGYDALFVYSGDGGYNE